jgi:hypothetical protein
MASNQTFSFDGKAVPMFALEATVQQIAHAIQNVAVNTQVLAAINAGSKFQGMQQQALHGTTKGMNKNLQNVHQGIGVLNKSFLMGTTMLATSLGQKLSELKNLSKGMDRLAVLFKPTATGGGIFASLTNFLTGSTIPGLGLLGKSLKFVGSSFKWLGVGIAAVLTVVEDYRKNLLDLTNFGTGFGTKMLEMERALAMAGVTIDDYVLVVQEHGAAVRNLGKNSQDAALQFAILAKNVRDTAKEFGAYGLTSQEINQFIGEYLELERRRGKTGAQAADGVESAFRSLALQTDAMARQTGRDRREALRAAMEAGGSRGVARRARALGGDQGENFTINVSRLAAMMTQTMGESAPDLVRAMTQAAAMGTGLELTDMREFLAMSGEAGSRLNDIIRNIDKMSPEEMARAYEDFGRQLAAQRDQRDQQGQEILAMTNQAARRYADLIVDYRQITNLTEETTKFIAKQRTNQQVAAEASGKFASGSQKLLGSYQLQMDDVATAIAALKVDLIEPLVERGDELAGSLTNFTEKIRAWTVPTEEEARAIQAGEGGPDYLEKIYNWLTSNENPMASIDSELKRDGRLGLTGGRTLTNNVS